MASRFHSLMMLCATLVFAVPAAAQRGDTTVARQLAPGVAYRQIIDKRGPWRMNLVRVNLKVARVELVAARAKDSLRGREKLSDMVGRAGVQGASVLAAINADFFELKSGENENNQVNHGEWWKGLKVTDSPYDTYENVHVQLATDALRHLYMDRFQFDGRFFAHGVMTPIIALNAVPTGTFEAVTLYTSRYGATTPRDSSRDLLSDTSRKISEAAMVAAGRHGDTLLFVRTGAVSTSSASSIPANGAVLSAYGPRTSALKSTLDGDTIKVLLTTLPRLTRNRMPAMIIGGWPRILRDGRNVAGEAATVEGTLSNNAEVRHPRSAIGFSRDSTRLYLLTVDGRSENSGGATLVELATIMRKLGAWQAMNFDGGGSTTMVIGNRVVNVPSDSAGERRIGNGLLLVKRK